ncbi:ABC superfamily ATP binding cassette transporter ABC protein [Bifidobacterium [indicum] DSM 20214 = LMG 11587]|uniref:ABC superfamily ATP binding cassette transporter ABC protein n=2 Tax=Bifidobacterium coryneforme TaxID=1687 RepID=A0A087VUD0_9BIFI|nr:ATP-binding cassette domain-containing protein [Bifidobacterium indicum]AIC91941.1 ABC superfamily ATP binding cassette transporter ABC protein [Bifidobacterium indicum LMG 11587 = DSM 20214]
MSDVTPLMEMSDISVKFGFVHALKQVSLSVRHREVLAVVGDNGAGKSTLIKIMSGLLHPDSGTMKWQGEAVTLPSIRAAAQLGVAAVFQGQSFCDNLDVSANLFLGKELRDNHLRRDDETMQERTRQVLQSLSSAIRVGQPMASLSMGQKQTVSIARTLLDNPQLILLDEPTSALSVMQTAEVLNYIKRMRAEGQSIVMVCHDLPDVFAVADRIAVMRQGRLVGVLETAKTSYETVVALISGIDPETVMNETERIDALTDAQARAHALRGTRAICLDQI